MASAATLQIVEAWKAKRDIRALVGYLAFPPTNTPGAREAAVAALCELKDPAAIKPLFDLLNGGFSVPLDCGYAVGDVLKAYGDSNLGLAVINILSGKGDPAAHAAQALGRMGEVRAAEPLANKLREQAAGEWRSRRDSAKALGVLGDRRAVEMLIWALQNDSSDQVRAEAAIALGLLGDDAAVAPLAELVSHKNKDVRAAVAQGLGESRNPAPVEHLLWLMKDKEWEVRVATAEALGKMNDERAIQPLKEALAGAIPVQRAAIKALEAMGQLRSSWPILNEAEAIVGEPVEAVGIFERDVRLKFGAMLMEVPLGCLFTLGLLLPALLLAAILGAVVGSFLVLSALGFGFAGAHHVMTKRRAKKEGISKEIALAITADGIHLINRDLEAGKPVLGRRFVVWNRHEVRAMIEDIPASFVQKVKITHGNESYELIPKEDSTSPGAFLKVISLFSEK
jgi:HEAT repeat protein